MTHTHTEISSECVTFAGIFCLSSAENTPISRQKCANWLESAREKPGNHLFCEIAPWARWQVSWRLWEAHGKPRMREPPESPPRRASVAHRSAPRSHGRGVVSQAGAVAELVGDVLPRRPSRRSSEAKLWRRSYGRPRSTPGPSGLAGRLFDARTGTRARTTARHRGRERSAPGRPVVAAHLVLAQVAREWREQPHGAAPACLAWAVLAERSCTLDQDRSSRMSPPQG